MAPFCISGRGYIQVLGPKEILYMDQMIQNTRIAKDDSTEVAKVERTQVKRKEKHLKDEHSHGTNAIQFPESGHTIKLQTRAALSTFTISKPTLEECENAPKENVITMGMENWNPQSHYDDMGNAT